MEFAPDELAASPAWLTSVVQRVFFVKHGESGAYVDCECYIYFIEITGYQSMLPQMSSEMRDKKLFF